MFWKKKVIQVPSDGKIDLDGIETWIVYWTSRHGSFNSDTTQKAQAFTNCGDAELFAESLRNAFSLLRHTGNETEVYIQIQE